MRDREDRRHRNAAASGHSETDRGRGSPSARVAAAEARANAFEQELEALKQQLSEQGGDSESQAELHKKVAELELEKRIGAFFLSKFRKKTEPLL